MRSPVRIWAPRPALCSPTMARPRARPPAPEGVTVATSPAADAAFTDAALAYLNPLYRTALRLTHNESDAEDLVQETYLKAFRAAEQFHPGTNLKAWLFKILTRS